jgi:DNA-binding transcriptional ArsR family regulator
MVTYSSSMDAVFRALADPSRRRLLDELFKKDGQTLSHLDSILPEMTRFGVMKHLRILEDAGLVTTRKVGREKLHYLNPVPIRLVHDRWISKYAEPWIGAISALKRELEANGKGPSDGTTARAKAAAARPQTRRTQRRKKETK